MKVLLTKDGQMDDGRFLDPKTGHAMTVDHMRLVCYNYIEVFSFHIMTVFVGII